MTASLILGLILYAAFMGILTFLNKAGIDNWVFTFIYERLLQRGSIPHIMTIGFTIGLALLFIRLPLITREYNRLKTWESYLAGIRQLNDNTLTHIPGGPGRTLTDSVIQQIVHRSTTAENRAEMDAMVDQITSVERRKLDASHVPVRYLIWLIPTLGFLGTVLGISLAVAGFSQVIATSTGETDMNRSLVAICHELAVAFDTTFVALIYSAIIALMMAFVDRRELSLLNTLDEFYALAIRARLIIHTKTPVVELMSPSPETTPPATPTPTHESGPGGALIMLQSSDATGENINLHDIAQQVVFKSLASLSEQGEAMANSLADAGVGVQLKHFIEANLIHMKEQLNWMQTSAITRDDIRQLSESFATESTRLRELLDTEIARQKETSAILEKLTAIADKLSTDGVQANIAINSIVSAPGNH